MFDLIVKDDFLPDSSAIRADVLSKGFQTVTNPGDGLEYVVQLRDPVEIQSALADLVGFPVKVAVHAARIHLKDEIGHQAIHCDACMAEFASVFYLTPPNAPATGTAFFRDTLTGWSEMPTKVYLLEQGLPEAAVVARLRSQANDISKWTSEGFVGAKLGRVVTYKSRRFHSRFPFSGFGETPEKGRLVITTFFDRA